MCDGQRVVCILDKGPGVPIDNNLSVSLFLPEAPVGRDHASSAPGQVGRSRFSRPKQDKIKQSAVLVLGRVALLPWDPPQGEQGYTSNDGQRWGSSG